MIDEKFLEAFMRDYNFEDIGIAVDELTNEVSFMGSMFYNFDKGCYTEKEFIKILRDCFSDIKEKTIMLNSVYNIIYDKMEEADG